MVASGFGEGPEWDHEYDGTYYGWDLFHKTLKHYLEHHRGQPGNNFVLYAMLPCPAAEAWDQLMSSQGFVSEGTASGLTKGGPFRFVTRLGDVFSGTVMDSEPKRTFVGDVESLNKAVLRLELSAIPGMGDFLYLSMNTWGVPKDDVEALGSRLKSIVYGLFPQPTETPAAACAVPEQ